MDILTALRQIRELETKLSDLYSWLSSVFAANDRTSLLFKTMHEEELTHAELVRYQERHVRRNPEFFGPVELSIESLRQHINTIALFQEKVPTLEAALRFSMEIENNAAEHYVTTAMQQSNVEFSKLLMNLSKTFIYHYNTLKEFSESMGVSVIPK